MQRSISEEPSDSLVAHGLTQVGDALLDGPKPNLRVRLRCFYTGSVHGVVGQQQMGQADQMQVIDDCSFMQHLIFAQPQALLQVLEQTSMSSRCSRQAIALKTF